jgi:iron complex outermembrane receptor protein
VLTLIWLTTGLPVIAGGLSAPAPAAEPHAGQEQDEQPPVGLSRAEARPSGELQPEESPSEKPKLEEPQVEQPQAEESQVEQPQADETPGATDRDGETRSGEEPADSEPPMSATEFVLVQESLPYVPSSSTIATKLPLSLMLTPSNIGVVGEPLLYEQDAVELSQALVNVSGVNVQPQSGVNDFFYVRGFDSITGSLVLTDGAREPSVSFYQMHNVERVELLKGPGGFLYGSSPLSGTVNIVRKRPEPQPFLDIGGSVGSYGLCESTLDYNQPAAGGDFRFRVTGLWRESDAFRDDKKSRTWGVTPAFAWRLGARGMLNLDLEFLRVERSPDGGIPLLVPVDELPDVSRQQSYQSPFDFSEQDVSRLQLNWESRRSDRLRLRDKLYFRDLDWQSNGTVLAGAFPSLFFDPSAPPGSFTVARNLTFLDDHQRVLGNQFEAVLSLKTGRVGHDLLVGLELEQLTDDYELKIAPSCSSGVAPAPFCMPDIDLFNPVETATTEPVGSPFESGDSTTEVIAPYVVDQISITPEWQLLLGARLDLLDFEDDVNRSSRSESEVSPMAGVVYAPSANLSLYASAGDAFSPPSPRTVGDPEPEKGTQYEVGLKKLLRGGRVQTTVAAYRLERENIGIPDATGFTQQVGDQLSRGIELDLAAEWPSRVRTFFSYAYNDSELTNFAERIIGFTCDGSPQPGFLVCDRSGNRPAFTPEHIFNFWVSKKYPGGFGVGGGGRYVSEQYIAEDNRFAMDEYITLDAALFYDWQSWRLKLNLRNITDTDFEMRGFPSNGVIPADPFTVYAGIEWRL